MTVRVRRLTDSEADFTQRVIELAHHHGWVVAHFRTVRIQRADGTTYYETPVQADGKGWPDLILVRESTGEIIVLELKMPGRKATPEQEQWLRRLRACGIPATVAMPEHFSLIEKALARP